MEDLIQQHHRGSNDKVAISDQQASRVEFK